MSLLLQVNAVEADVVVGGGGGLIVVISDWAKISFLKVQD